MRKAVIINLLGILVLSFGPLQIAADAQDSRTEIPKACYFFAPEKVSAKELAEEREYALSFTGVYEAWCTPNLSSSDQRTAAVNTMVRRWKVLWDRSSPYNAVSHESGASDLLALIALTHELPIQMLGDSRFTEEWIKACEDTCFTIWAVPENKSDEHRIAMQLWLRNDVLDHLKREPASEPVIKMLQNAEFRLVD